MNKNLTILLFLLIGFSISAQNGPKYIREAYASFESGKYFEAIDKCQSAFTKLGSKGSLKQKGDMAFRIAESYRLLERYESANEWLDVCVELKYFDVNPSVIGWASEEVVIPYYDSMSKKVRRYFPDFLIKVKTKDGKLRTHLIEVKPTKDLRPPVGGKGKKKSTVLYELKTYQMNRDKFASARKWCDDRNIIFDIWTEKHLRQKG